MTTENRMREALEDLIAAIEPILTDEQLEHRDPSHAACVQHFAPTVRARLNAAREALSPPARRTSYEWEFPGDSTKYSVRWGSEGQWSIWAMNWRSQGEFEECGFGEFAFAIATLDSLTPPEEEA